MRFTGRDEEHLALVEAYAKGPGLWHDGRGARPSVLRVRLASTSVTSSPRWPDRLDPRTGSRCPAARDAVPGRLDRGPAHVQHRAGLRHPTTR